VPTRRELLATFGLLGAAAATGCVPPPTPATDDRTPDPTEDWPGGGQVDDAQFPAGVSCGDPLPDALLLWTLYTGEATLQVVVARWEGGAWVEEDPVDVEVADTGHVHHDLRDRAADAPLAFQFVDADGHRSPVGTGRTAMAEDATGVVRLGATSCTDQVHVGFPNVADTAARGPLDFWAWLGDFAYFDSEVTPEDFQALWTQNLSDPGLRAVLAHTASIFTWDDHEVGNNWSNDTDYDPQRVAIGRAAFFANTPLRPEVPDRIWRRLRFGTTAEVIVLDCRSERDPVAGRYMSEAQLSWLIDTLQGSPCTWKVVLNSVPFANLPGPYDTDISRMDRWGGYPADRQRVEDAIAQADLSGVLFVSGDIHHPAIFRVEPTGRLAQVLDIACGPGGHRRSPFATSVAGLPGVVWTQYCWSSTRLHLYPQGIAKVHVIGDDDQDWLVAWVDTHGRVYDLDALPLD